jgi:type IV pilus assembly protein PilA
MIKTAWQSMKTKMQYYGIKNAYDSKRATRLAIDGRWVMNSRKLYRKMQQGFTMIELMIVIAIIGTLASIAIPAFQGYAVRAKVIEGMALAAAAKTIVSENVVNGLPFSSGWVAPYPTKIVNTDHTGASRLPANSGISINDANGEITITYTDIVATGSPTLLLIPVDGANPLTPGLIIQTGMVNWECHSSNPPINNVLRTHTGTIDPQFVPADCRA